MRKEGEAKDHRLHSNADGLIVRPVGDDAKILECVIPPGWTGGARVNGKLAL